jgi:ABC-type microcin C transport system permease subunit YejB
MQQLSVYIGGFNILLILIALGMGLRKSECNSEHFRRWRTAILILLALYIPAEIRWVILEGSSHAADELFWSLWENGIILTCLFLLTSRR